MENVMKVNYYTYQIMGIIPWAVVLKPAGVTIQFLGLAVQIMGLIMMFVKRKDVWN